MSRGATAWSPGSKSYRLPRRYRQVLRIFRYASALRSRISLDSRMSSRKSTVATHRRRTSSSSSSSTAPTSCDPQAQDVGAVLLDDVLRRDDVAERLGHLAPLAVQGEPVRQDAAVGGLAPIIDRD